MDRIEFKSARKNLELTQAEFAAKLGVTVTTVCNWEAGRRKVSKTVEILIAMLVKEKM